MLSHVFPTSILFRSQSVLLFYILVSVPNYCLLLFPLLFLVQIIVSTTSFKNTSMFLVMSNCILVLVVLESHSI